jgi:glycosyltransferase involved in cell wall biosynthesis
MVEAGWPVRHGSLPTGYKIIAVIPCFNTGRTIREVAAHVRRYVDRVVVINDGSTDDTGEAAKSAGADVVTHSSRLGYAETLRSAFRLAKQENANIMVTIDGDAQHNPAEITRVLSPILDGEADMVVGSRFLTAVQEITGQAGLTVGVDSLLSHAMPAYRRFGIRLITWLFNLGHHDKLTDAQSGFRAYSHGALDICYPRGKGMGVSLEILLKARASGLRIKEVPITCIYHRASSTRNPAIHGLEVIFTAIKLKLSHMPLRRGK